MQDNVFTTDELADKLREQYRASNDASLIDLANSSISNEDFLGYAQQKTDPAQWDQLTIVDETSALAPGWGGLPATIVVVVGVSRCGDWVGRGLLVAGNGSGFAQSVPSVLFVNPCSKPLALERGWVESMGLPLRRHPAGGQELPYHRHCLVVEVEEMIERLTVFVFDLDPYAGISRSGDKRGAIVVHVGGKQDF